MCLYIPIFYRVTLAVVLCLSVTLVYCIETAKDLFSRDHFMLGCVLEVLPEKNHCAC